MVPFVGQPPGQVQTRPVKSLRSVPVRQILCRFETKEKNGLSVLNAIIIA